MSDALNPVASARARLPDPSGRLYPGGAPPNPAVSWIRDPDTGLYIQEVMNRLDLPMAELLSDVVAALRDTTTSLTTLNATEVLGNGKLDALADAVRANEASTEALATILETLVAKAQAEVDAVATLIGAVNGLKASVDMGNDIAQKNLAAAQAATDLAYRASLAANAPVFLVTAGAKGAQLTTVAAAKGDSLTSAILALLGGGAGEANFYWADTKGAPLSQGTSIAIVPFAGNDSNSAFEKATIPAGKHLMVVSNVSTVSASCTVRQI